MPEKHGLLAQLLDHRLISVVVAVRPGKADDAEFHVALHAGDLEILGDRIGEQSLAHVARRSLGGRCGRRASISTTTCRPTWTSRTAAKPSVCSASATVRPCGSRMPRRGVMCTATRKRVIRSDLSWDREGGSGMGRLGRCDAVADDVAAHVPRGVRRVGGSRHRDGDLTTDSQASASAAIGRAAERRARSSSSRADPFGSVVPRILRPAYSIDRGSQGSPT